MIFEIEQIPIELIEEGKSIRLKSANEEFLFSEISMDETQDIILKNFDLVRAKYLKANVTLISNSELNEVCLRIVFLYLDQYSFFRSFYEKHKNRSLAFDVEDFEHPYTYHKVIQCFKWKYPKNYIEICAGLLNIDPSKLIKFEKDQAELYDMF